MSATANSNTPLSTESKSATKKRKGKAETGSSSTTAPAIQSPEQAPNGVHDNPGESHYLRELNKNIRNLHKKLAASAKTDAVIAEYPDKTLDELVSAKKINADQKMQALKKPALQAQLAQLEEQLSQYRNFGQEYEARFAEEKASIRAAHETELVQARADAAAETREELNKKHEMDLLMLSQFLHAAAAKRQSEEAETQEGRAYEGVLLLAYQGNNSSLETLRNLVNGTDDRVPDTQGELLDFTFAQLKRSALENAPVAAEMGENDLADPASSSSAVEAAPVLTSSDPTVANAALTELEDTPMIRLKGEEHVAELTTGPEQGSVTAEAANTVAESSWDPQASVMTTDSGAGDGWVEVPRDPRETDTGLTATPAAVHGASNWAEEVTEGAAAQERFAVENDGFEQVVHHANRARTRGRGEFRGRAGRGDRIGRGRGDGDSRRGRGRGRGPEGGYRGGGRAGRANAPAGDTATGSSW